MRSVALTQLWVGEIRTAWHGNLVAKRREHRPVLSASPRSFLNHEPRR